MNQNEDTPTKQSFTSVLAIIDKIQELHWTLHLATAVLFADLVLLWRGERGIIHWSTSADQLLAHAGLAITGVLAFGVLMSFAMPLAFWIFQRIGLWLSPYISWMRAERDYRPSYGEVYPTALRDYALRKGDKLLLDICEAHEEKQIAQFLEEFATGKIMFSVLVLAALDYLADYLPGIQGTSVLQELVLLGRLGEIALTIGFLLVVAAVISFVWLAEYTPDFIYYPPLYEEAMEKKRKKEIREL